MSYASILVHVEHGSTSSDARLELAATLARRFHAALIGVAAGAVRPPPVDAFGGAMLVGEALVVEEEEIQAELKAAEETFRAHWGARELVTEWRAAVDMPAEYLAAESRAADLIIVGRDLDRLQAGIYRSADPSDVMMAAGRPVLVVPPGIGRLSAQNVIVGWKDAREARRAISDALTLLQAADGVQVVEFTEEEGTGGAGSNINAVVHYLKRHQVKAQGVTRTLRERSAADELVLMAEQQGADLIVAGGYGHTRLREWVLGGVTRDLLRNSPKCCLLSH